MSISSSRAFADVLALAGGEVVDDDDLVAERDERVDHVRADEPGTPVTMTRWPGTEASSDGAWNGEAFRVCEKSPT